MSDLNNILPDFDSEAFQDVLQSLERAKISCSDLISLDAVDTARRANVANTNAPVSVSQVRDLSYALISQLHDQLGFNATKKSQDQDSERNDREWSYISTLDDGLDAALGGGFPAGQVCEITGESAAGKTQFLLTLLLSVQLQGPKGLGRNALYLSTEAPLSTTRLQQILDKHPYLSSLPPSERPSLSRVQSAQMRDVESQDHLLRYQVPVQIARADIGLIIIDSVAANFRAEFDRTSNASTSDALARRSAQLTQLGCHLRHLAHTHNLAIVVANQVLDRFGASSSLFDSAITPTPLSQTSVSTPVSNSNNPPPPSSQHPSQFLSTNDPLSLDHQQRFFTGWGDIRFARDLKTPSLGLTWTNQLSARFVLLKEPIMKPQDYLLGPGMDIIGWRRHLKVAFAAWAADANGAEGVEFEVCEEGVRIKQVSEAPSEGNDKS